MKKVLIIKIVFSLYALNFYGQSTLIDSLSLALKNAKQDSVKCSILNEMIANEYNETIWSEFNKQLLEISEKNLKKSTTDKSRGVFLSYYALALNNYGFLYTKQGDILKAFEFYNKSIMIQKENNDKHGMAGSFENLGYLNRQQGNIQVALDYYHKALKLQLELNDKLGVATSYNNIGFVYENQGEFQKAMEYYNKALEIYNAINDKNGIAVCYTNLSSIYENHGNLFFSGSTDDHKKEGQKKALEYLNKAIKIQNEINDLEGLSSSINCIGNIYEHYGDPSCNSNIEDCKGISKEKALEYYLKSLKIREEINNKVGVTMSYSSIGEFYFAQGKIEEAHYYADLCLKRAKELGYPENIKDAAYLLKRIYEKQSKHRQALEMYELFVQMRDSIINLENKKTTYKKQIQIEYEIQATKDSISNAAKIREEQLKHEQEIIRQQFYAIGGVFGFILMLIVAVVSLKAYKNKKKANEKLAQQNCEILKQKEEIITQRDEIEVQRDKLSSQNIILEEQKIEITDSITYAKRIQNAVLPNSGYLDEILIDYFILFKPKSIVSGDFYWTLKINQWIIVSVADCTGHGVPGAFMSMLGISFLNEIKSREEIKTASSVLDELRQYVIDSLQQKGIKGEQQDGMDIGLCAIDTITLEMQFAGANNPCWIVSHLSSVVSPLIELKPDKQPIGIHTNMTPFTNQKYQLQKGDLIYLMSDGYEDQFGGPNRKKFLAKNLKNLLIANSQKLMAEQKRVLETNINEWIGGGEQIDDITLLGIKI